MLLFRLTVANLKMILRNRQAMFWAMAFPLIFVVVFGVFFQDRPDTTTIAVIDNAQDEFSTGLVNNLSQIETFVLDRRLDEAAARKEIGDGDLSYLLIIPAGFAASIASNPPVSIILVHDDTNPLSGVVVGVVQRFVDQTNLSLANAPNRLTLDAQGVLTSDVDFMDFLLPGLAIWGVMSYSVIGLATTMASYREKKILRRILATPLKVRIFFAAQMVAFLVLALIQATIILAVGAFLFGASIKGNFLYVAILILLGNIVFLNMGFIVGTYSKTVSAASGLGNAVVLPMMFFSGVFFPTDGLPSLVQTMVDVFPLAPLLDAMRGVTIEAKPFWEFPVQLATLAAWIALTAFVAIRTFRFR